MDRVILGEVVHTNPSYFVEICEITEAESGNPLIVYGVFNRAYGVREAELRSFSHAVGWADKLDEGVQQLTADDTQAELLLAAMDGSAPKAEASE